MVSCCECQGIESKFDPRTARRDLKRLRRRGPLPATRLLLDDLRARGVAGASLLDIGGGVGAIHHALLDAGAATALQVDISSAYLAAAREEATRRGHGERVRFTHGDFVQQAPALPDADIVTLDRVICCYPDMETLVGLAAGKARRVLGAVYPRAGWGVRVGIWIENLLARLRRSDFRVYLHAPAAIDRVLRAHGLERATLRRTLAWEVATWARPGA